MDLFLNNSWESRLVEHFVHFTNNARSVNIIRLSPSTITQIQSGNLSIQVPSLISSPTESFTSSVGICMFLAQRTRTKEFLFGVDKKAESANISYLEIAKTNKNFIKDLNVELATKTFLTGAHVSFADLAVFYASYNHLATMLDEDKWEINNFYRWFNHIQNLPNVQNFLLSNNLPKSSFPKRQEAQAAATKAKKEKKIGTQAPVADKKEKKQQQQQPKADSKQQNEPKEESKQQDKPKQDKKEKKQNAKKQEVKVESFPADHPQFFNQFIDIRVGELKKVWKHPDSENLWCEEIDVGEEKVRQIASGLQKIIPLENMTGLVCVYANLKSRKLAGFDSNGMVMCSSTVDKSKTEILRPPANAKVGDRVVLEGFEGQFTVEPLSVPNSKKKVLEQAFPLLKADADGHATYAGVRFSVGGQFCKSESIKDGVVA